MQRNSLNYYSSKNKDYDLINVEGYDIYLFMDCVAQQPDEKEYNLKFLCGSIRAYVKSKDFGDTLRIIKRLFVNHLGQVSQASNDVHFEPFKEDLALHIIKNALGIDYTNRHVSTNELKSNENYIISVFDIEKVRSIGFICPKPFEEDI
ncbi:UNVERIFIED_CONTAM: hypothetical protein Cloal_1165 [Acetivibrio alkalicellulosi]